MPSPWSRQVLACQFSGVDCMTSSVSPAVVASFVQSVAGASHASLVLLQGFGAHLCTVARPQLGALFEQVSGRAGQGRAGQG